MAGDLGNALCVNSACMLHICIYVHVCVGSKRKTEQLTISLYVYVHVHAGRERALCAFRDTVCVSEHLQLYM